MLRNFYLVLVKVTCTYVVWFVKHYNFFELGALILRTHNFTQQECIQCVSWLPSMVQSVAELEQIRGSALVIWVQGFMICGCNYGEKLTCITVFIFFRGCSRIHSAPCSSAPTWPKALGCRYRWVCQKHALCFNMTNSIVNTYRFLKNKQNWIMLSLGCSLILPVVVRKSIHS